MRKNDRKAAISKVDDALLSVIRAFIDSGVKYVTCKSKYSRARSETWLRYIEEKVEQKGLVLLFDISTSTTPEIEHSYYEAVKKVLAKKFEKVDDKATRSSNDVSMEEAMVGDWIKEPLAKESQANGCPSGSRKCPVAESSSDPDGEPQKEKDTTAQSRKDNQPNESKIKAQQESAVRNHRLPTSTGEFTKRAAIDISSDSDVVNSRNSSAGSVVGS